MHIIKKKPFSEILRNIEDIATLSMKHKGVVKVWLGPKLYIGKWNELK